jgi:hypothetical protein
MGATKHGEAMSIVLNCGKCHTRLTVADDRAGTEFECPACDAMIQLPLSLDDATLTPHPTAGSSFEVVSIAKWSWAKLSPRAKIIIPVAGVLAVVLTTTALLAWPRTLPPAADDGSRTVPLAVDERKDMQSYIRELKPKIPVQIEQFKSIGLKADSYEPSNKFPDLFGTVTVKVDRVYLEDKVTGKSGLYSRAKLTSCYHNFTGPTVRISSSSDYARHAYSSALREIWPSVEMLQ